MKKKIFVNKIQSFLLALVFLVTATIGGIHMSNNPVTASAERVAGGDSVAKEVAEEGIVLLKNDNDCLPFTSNMAVGGWQPSTFIYGGGGSGEVHTASADLISPKAGFDNAVGANRLKSYTEITSASGAFDRVIYYISRTTQEGWDRVATENDSEKGDKGQGTYYYLMATEKANIQSLCATYGKDKVAVLLNVPSVVDTTWLIEQDVGAIMVVWLPGEQAGNAIADVCCGVVSPSGKLADTWAKDLQYYPSTKNGYYDSGDLSADASNYWMNDNLATLQNSKNAFGEPGPAYYEEDIYLGYRYFETFDPTYQLVNYEFGYGLSYTTFDIDVTSVKVNSVAKTIRLLAKVTNTGDRAGKEVVQVYYSTPNNLIDSPAKQLIAFKKTKTLQAGESQTLTLEFDIEEMSQFDDTGVIALDYFVMQQGDYHIFVGNSVKDAGKNLVATYQQKASNTVGELLTHIETNLARRLTSNGTYEDLNTDYYTVKAGGMTIVQAEDYYSSTAKAILQSSGKDNYFVKRYTFGTMGSGRYIDTSIRGNTLRYRLYVEQAGVYNVDFIMCNGYNVELTDCLEMYVDYSLYDQVDNGADQNITVDIPACGTNWEDFKRYTGNTVEFTQAGWVYLTIKANDTCTNLDSFILYNNNVSSVSQTRLYATSFTSAVDTQNSEAKNVAVAEVCPDGTVIGYLGANKEVTYTVNVAAAGDYYLDLDASSCVTASNNAATVYINGVAQSTPLQIMRTACNPNEDIASVPKSCYYVFTKTNQIKVHFDNAGTATIKLQFNDGAITNLLSVNLTPTSIGQERAYTYTDNTADFTALTDFETDGNGDEIRAQNNGKDFYYMDVVQGKCSVETFLDQMHSSELAWFTGLYCGVNRSSLNGGTMNYKLEDVNSGVGGFGGIPDEATGYYYHIPYAATADGPAGVRFDKNVNPNYYYSTYFPCMTMAASTWNEELIEEFGVIFGKEARLAGIEVMLAPGMNIHRNPLGGRNFEYLSEDPYVTGVIATAITKGCQSTGVSVSLKHFAANNQEGDRFNSDSKVSARALREIYFKAFEMVIKEANPGTMMTCYNLINGESVAESYTLLTEIVRGEWGYEGVIESDWWENVNDCFMVNAGNNLHSASPDYSLIQTGYTYRMITREKLIENASYVINFLIRSQASSLSNAQAMDTNTSVPTATEQITCTDGSGKVWNPMYSTNNQIISESNSVWEARLASGIHGAAKHETKDGTTYITAMDADSGAYGSITVTRAGTYYLGYTLCIPASTTASFKLYIDNKLVDTFNDSTKTTTDKPVYGSTTVNQKMEALFAKDTTVQLTAGVHRIYIDFEGTGFDFHNIVFSYGSTANQTINGDFQLEVQNYASATGDVRIEGDHLASLTNGSKVSYNLTVEKAGTYALRYLLNIPQIKGKFEIYLDGEDATDKIGSFMHNTATNANNWTTFGWRYGNDANGDVKETVYLTEGTHTLYIKCYDQDYNFKTIAFDYVGVENHADVAADASVLSGASIWVSKENETGKIKFTFKTEDEVDSVIALIVKTADCDEYLNLANYQSYGAEKLVCEANGASYVAEMDVDEANYATEYTVIFYAVRNDGDITSYGNATVSDARSCRIVAQNLIDGDVYTLDDLGYYL